MFSSVLRMCVLTLNGSADRDRFNHGILTFRTVNDEIQVVCDHILYEYLENLEKPRAPPLAELTQVNACTHVRSSSTEKEEKAIAAIKKEPIPVDQFLQKLREKKLDKILNFEVRVSNQRHFPIIYY